MGKNHKDVWKSNSWSQCHWWTVCSTKYFMIVHTTQNHWLHRKKYAMHHSQSFLSINIISMCYHSDLPKVVLLRFIGTPFSRLLTKSKNRGSPIHHIPHSSSSSFMLWNWIFIKKCSVKSVIVLFLLHAARCSPQLSYSRLRDYQTNSLFVHSWRRRLLHSLQMRSTTMLTFGRQNYQWIAPLYEPRHCKFWLLRFIPQA
jgi:hypothetical protein